MSKNKNPWDIRDSSLRGDANEGALFDAVGRALTEWEQVEYEFARLFAVLVSAHQRNVYHAPALRAYGAVVSFKTRAEMIREAAAAYFKTRKQRQSTFSLRLKPLIDEYMAYSHRRNEIAHGSVKKVFVTERKTKKGHRQGAIGLYLLPSFFNPKKFKNEVFTYRYTSSDLIHYRQEFTKLSLRIGALREDMQPKRR